MNVLAVFAHPDDEVLGCGGTLAKHAEAGDSVNITLFCGRGLGSEAEAAAGVLLGGLLPRHLRFLNYDDQALDQVLFTLLTAEAGPVDADVIYTHHPGDLNTDHALVAKAVLTAFRPKPGEKPRTILACEVLSSTEWTFPPQFQPNWFESLGDDRWGLLQKKILAMRCYESEYKRPRDQFGIMTLAQYRGHQCGVRYAEAFQLLRRGPM